jgi:hypothetical protein
MSATASTLSFNSGASINLVSNSFDRTATSTITLVDLNGTADALLSINGSDVTAGSTITTFTSTGGNAGSNSGSLNLNLSGFSLVAGDQFVLRRDTATGDLVLDFVPVPEPGTMLAVGAGVLGLGAFLRRKLTKSATPDVAA